MTTLDRIKELCKSRGISVPRLEEELNIPRNTIYQWKRISPSLEKIEKIADYFNVSTDYVLGRSNVKQKADELESLAAHKIGEDWTDEERAVIEEFIEFTLNRRKKRGE